MMFNKNFLKITSKKKLNHKPSGSTEMAHKYLACQFFFYNSYPTWFIKIIEGTGGTLSLLIQ